MAAVIFVLAGTGFLALAAVAVFVFIVVSIHRTPRVPLAKIRGKRVGSAARRVLAGVGTGSREDSE